MIYVMSFREKPPEDVMVINTTSRGQFTGLSPFFCGPVRFKYEHLDGSSELLVSENMENYWQYSKVYSAYFKGQNFQEAQYLKWAKAGWRSVRAHRYPMGKGAAPVCAIYRGRFVDYVQSRVMMYFTAYRNTVRRQEHWAELKKLSRKQDICLLDFDGRRMDKTGETLLDVALNPRRKMGHAFVLKAMLDYDEDVTVADIAKAEGRIKELQTILNRKVFAGVDQC